VVVHALLMADGLAQGAAAAACAAANYTCNCKVPTPKTRLKLACDRKL